MSDTKVIALPGDEECGVEAPRMVLFDPLPLPFAEVLEHVLCGFARHVRVPAVGLGSEGLAVRAQDFHHSNVDEIAEAGVPVDQRNLDNDREKTV